MDVDPKEFYFFQDLVIYCTKMTDQIISKTAKCSWGNVEKKYAVLKNRAKKMNG